jgi:GGDEF domain-containing protein
VNERIHAAEQHAAMISTALDGESAVMPVVGHIEGDENPIRMLAVGLEHAHLAISALTDEVRNLRSELERRDDLHGARLRVSEGTSVDVDGSGLEGEWPQ